MSRDGSGNYSLPLPPVVTGTTIEATWANTTLDDIKTALTDSLSRTGNGNMSTVLKLVDGAVGAPGLAFTSEASSGLYRAAATDVRMAVSGVDKMRWTTANGVQVFDTSWKTVATASDLVADGTVESQSLRWNNSSGAWEANSNITMTAAGGLGAVQIGINEASPDAMLHATNTSSGDIAILETPTTPTSHSGLRIAKGGTAFSSPYLKVGFDENAAPSISYGSDSQSGTGSLLLRNEYNQTAAGLKFQAWNGSTYDDWLFINGSGGTWIYALGTGTVYSNSGFLQNSDPSDRRLKKYVDSIDIEKAADAVIGIEAKSFEWKSRKRGEGTQLGFIAQDVQKYLPELVEEGHDGKLGIKAQQLVPVLWQVVRDLMLRVEELEAKQ